ncbi:hypothetical protein ACW14X_18780 [Nocardioides sp. YJ-D4]
MRRMTVAIGAALSAITLAACGGGADDGGVATLSDKDAGSSASPSANAEDVEQQWLDFAACMRENGVDMPDPEFTEDGGVRIQGQGGKGAMPDPEVRDKAMKACEDKRPEGGIGGPRDPEEVQEMQDRVLEFAACMRENGVNVPDPDFSGGGVMMRMPEGIDPEDPKVQAAEKKCAEESGMDEMRKGGSQ